MNFIIVAMTITPTAGQVLTKVALRAIRHHSLNIAKIAQQRNAARIPEQLNLKNSIVYSVFFISSIIELECLSFRQASIQNNEKSN